MSFKPLIKFSNSQGNKSCILFVFSGNKILVQDSGESLTIPKLSDLPDINAKLIFLGTLNEQPCYGAELSESVIIPEKLKFKVLRNRYGCLDSELYKTAGFALQILNWDKDNQFCSRCGSEYEI